MPRKTTLINTIKQEMKNTRDRIDVLRRANDVIDAVDDLRPAADIWERIWLGFQRLIRSVRHELLYAALVSLKLLLIVAFNFVAVFIFFWLLSLL